MRTLLVERMSWRDIQEAIAAGYDTILQMVGSVEQHGPHLPVGTDTVLGYAWGEAIAHRLGNTLVAPVIRPGFSPHHEGFPGTMSLDEATLAAIIGQSCRSWAMSGFKKIVLLCSHGGNWPTVHKYLRRFQAQADPTAQVLTLAPEVVQDIEKRIYAFLEQKGIAPGRAGIHAGLRETAYMMWIAGELVNTDAIEPGFIHAEAIRQLESCGSVRALSTNGILGDPRGADPELGRELNELTVRLHVEALLKELKKQ